MKPIRFHTFPAGNTTPKNIIFPRQTHSANIREIITGNEDLSDCDGIWTKNPNLLLGIKTADCAPVVFLGKQRFGLAHAGWRGLQKGILEQMRDIFTSDLHTIWIGPLHLEFTIQQDSCYQQLQAKFGNRFFRNLNNEIQFSFLDAVLSIIPEAEFCGHSTFENSNYASWRRDRSFPKGQNITVIGSFDQGRSSP